MLELIGSSNAENDFVCVEEGGREDYLPPYSSQLCTHTIKQRRTRMSSLSDPSDFSTN